MTNNSAFQLAFLYVGDQNNIVLKTFDISIRYMYE